jgi:putative acetyltransferase
LDRTHPVEALTIRRADLHSHAAQRLIEALNAELRATYPEPGATHFRLDADEVTADNGAFLIGYLEGEPVACGAIRCIAAGVAEIKRMYVIPAARGRGFSTSILVALEENGRQLGVRRLVLETGPRQLEALALYRRAGYVPVPRFGEYLDSELSLCMGKDLKQSTLTSGSESEPPNIAAN